MSCSENSENSTRADRVALQPAPTLSDEGRLRAGSPRSASPRHRVTASLLLLGAALGLMGAVAPWIPHRAAGLNISAFDLFEVSKFLPEIRSGAVPLFREALLFPLQASALLLALAPVCAGRVPRALRWLCPATAALIALAAIPPYPAILTAYRDPEYRGQLLLAAATFLLVLFSPLARRLGRFVPCALVAGLALTGPIAGLAALARVRPLFVQLYHAPIGVGWGVVVYLLGCAVALVAAVFQTRSSRNVLTSGIASSFSRK